MKYGPLSLLIIVVMLQSCTPKRTMISADPALVEKEASTTDRPKNIILLIGDGMGVTQISSGLYSNSNKLHLERFPNIGLHKSYASNDLITDSAAGATAFACGRKTYNGAIAVDPDTIPMQTILEEAELRGLRTGLVATSTITHATPASFIAHNKSRKNYEEIALDFLQTDTEVFIGGGQKEFDRREMDDRILSAEFTALGYDVFSYVDYDLEDIRSDTIDKLFFFTADSAPLPASQGRSYLAPAASTAVNILDRDNKDGFFLMIEGSQIDWGGHANDAEMIITEMIDFDKMIGRVLDFAERDGNTLVIVTADHETGGFAIQKESKMDSLVTAFTSDYHTGDLIPVFAYGPGSDLFRGIYENTAIYHKMRQAIGWPDRSR